MSKEIRQKSWDDNSFTYSIQSFIIDETIRREHIEEKIRYLAEVVGRFIQGASDLIPKEELKEILGIQYYGQYEIVESKTND